MGVGHGIGDPTGAPARSGHTPAPFDRPIPSTGVDPYHAAMAQYASALSQHPVAAHAVGEAAGEILEAFGGEEPDLVLCFVSPHFVGAFDDFAYALGNLLEPDVLIGATAVAVIGGSHEVEDGPGGLAVRGADARRPAHAGFAHARDHARRPGDHGMAGARPRSGNARAPHRSVQLPDRRVPPPARRGPPRAPGDRRRGVGGPGTGREPARARRSRGGERGGRRADRRRRGEHRGLAGMPSARPSLRRDPRRAEPGRGARRSARAVAAPGLARPRRATKTAS